MIGKLRGRSDSSLDLHEGAICQYKKNDRCASVIIGKFKYSIYSDDDYLDSVSGTFEPDMVRLFSLLVGSDDVVFDVGANIGCTSILFSQLASKVYSFEPSPSTFQYLEMNVNHANAKNINMFNVGLGNGAGKFTLTFASNNRAGGFVSDKMQASSGHQVEDIIIEIGDDFISKNSIAKLDFIKIDVEGFELNVINGLRSTIMKFEPVVVLELNHWCLNALQRMSVPDFFDALRNIFPFLYAIDKDDIRNLHNSSDAYHVMYHHIVHGFKYPNIVASFSKDRVSDFLTKYVA